MFHTETRFTVRYAETDRMGIVHHSNYPVWFEAGRTDFIKALGMPYSEVESKGFLLPLIELKCFFKGAARYEDEITVRTGLRKATYTRVAFCYEILKNNGAECITEGETVHVWTNRAIKPLNIRKHAPDIHQLLENALE